MKRRPPDIHDELKAHLAASEKVRMWAERAQAARAAGKTAQAKRAEDKARDWQSRILEMERRYRDQKRSRDQ